MTKGEKSGVEDDLYYSESTGKLQVWQIEILVKVLQIFTLRTLGKENT